MKTDCWPDLHAHSTASDGALEPRQLVERAAQAGVTCLALTDHDQFSGSDRLQKESTPIPVIPGVELSLKDMHGLHLLGYGFAPAPELRRTVADLAEKRRSRARIMVDRLTALGMPLDYEEIASLCQGSVGRPHIARVMLGKGYIASFQEAFERWIGEDCPAYYGGERLSMREALTLMRREGFVPVLAHPMELEQEEHTLRMLVESWKEQGLMGMEVYHPSALRSGFSFLDGMARSMGLLVTGGSDYHTDGDKHGALGSMACHWRGRSEDLAALLEAAGYQA